MIRSKWPIWRFIPNRLRAEYQIIKKEFDRDYYLNRYEDVRSNGIDPCLHYLRYGWKESRNPTPWFNGDFYLRANPDVRDAAVNPFVHYIKFGRAEGRQQLAFDFHSAQADALLPLSSNHGAAADRPIAGAAFDLPAYERSSGQTFSSLQDALEDVVRRGHVPPEALTGGPGLSADLLTELGDRCRLRRLNGPAEHFYSQALEHNPAHFFALQHLADSRFDRRNFAGAVELYRAAEAINPNYVWTHANLAKALFELDRFDEAICHAKIAQSFGESSAATWGLWEAFTHARGNRLVQAGFIAAKRGDLRNSRKLMNKAVALGATVERPTGQPFSRCRSKTNLRVAILADDTIPQCLLYRVTNKVFQLRGAGTSVEWFAKARLKEFESFATLSDVAIFYRIPGTPEVIDLIRHLRALGKNTYYEIDDLIFNGEYYPEPYESYAGLITPEQYAGLAAGAELFRLAMSECDFGIASTAALAEQMKKELISGEALVVPNSLGPDHLYAEKAFTPHHKRKRKIRLFYGSGTLAHKNYFEKFTRDVLAPVLQNNKNVALTLMGTFPKLPALAAYGSRVKKKKPDWNYANYLAELSRADINIAALPTSTFNNCKSEIKWLEAALFAVPSVLSRTTTHELTVEDGTSGFLCSSPKQWVATLQRLIDDSSLRHEVGIEAKKAVNAEYNSAKVGKKLMDEFTRRVEFRRSDERKLRIVVVNVFFPPRAIGGATRVVQESVDSLVRRYGDAIEVLVFTTSGLDGPAYSIHEYDYNGVRVTAVRLDARPRFEWNARDDRIKSLFAQYLEFYRPDIVHFHCLQRLTASIIEATREAKIPHVVTVHDGWWLSDHQFLVDSTGRVHTGHHLTIEGMRELGAAPASVERTKYLRDLLANASSVISVSAPFAALYEGTGLRNVVVVENGTIMLDPIERSSQAGEKVQIGFIGGLAAHKGFDLISQIWATNTFQNIELVLVDHSQSAMKARRALWNANPVKIVGRVPQSRIETLYASLDVLLAPSIWPESFGLVTREAAQVGLWIVASDRGAIGDAVVEGANGFRVDVSDTTSLLAVLKEIDAGAERFKQRTNCPMHFRSFDEQVDQLVALYKSIVRTPESSPARHQSDLQSAK